MIGRMPEDYSASNPHLGTLYAEHLQTVKDRHDAVLEHAGAAHAVVFSGTPRTAFLDDQAYTFVPNPHFLGWAPLGPLPMSYVAYTPGSKPVLIYYQPRDYWNVVPDNPSGYWTAHFDIRIVRDRDEIAGHLPKNRDKCILIGEVDDPAAAFGIERVNPAVVLNHLHFVRGVKTEYELACMRLASRRAAHGHLAAESAFRAGESEFEIHRAYTAATRHTDAELPYPNIVALNRHGSVLHYTNLDREAPVPIRSLLIDAGAQVHGYAADVTRTYASDDRDFADLVARMDALQQDIVASLRPGVAFGDFHADAHSRIAALLVDAGLASGDPHTLLTSGVTSAFFPHGLGHLLGLQVHDVGGRMANSGGATIDPPSGHPYLRTTRKLEEDMVITIEPGLYVIDMLLDNLRGTPAEDLVNADRVAWLRPFGGIRIEDNVRITASGTENLTRDAFAAVSAGAGPARAA